MTRDQIEELQAFRRLEPVSPEWAHLHWQMGFLCSALAGLCGQEIPISEFLMVKPKRREQTGKEQYNFLKMFAAIHNASVKAGQ